MHAFLLCIRVGHHLRIWEYAKVLLIHTVKKFFFIVFMWWEDGTRLTYPFPLPQKVKKSSHGPESTFLILFITKLDQFPPSYTYNNEAQAGVLIVLPPMH